MFQVCHFIRVSKLYSMYTYTAEFYKHERKQRLTVVDLDIMAAIMISAAAL